MKNLLVYVFLLIWINSFSQATSFSPDNINQGQHLSAQISGNTINFLNQYSSTINYISPNIAELQIIRSDSVFSNTLL